MLAFIDLTQEHYTQFVSPDHLAGALVYLAVTLVAAALLTRLFRGFIDLGLSKDRFGIVDRTAAMFLRQVGVAVIWIVLLVLYAHLIPGLRNLGTALLAGVSIVSVVIGLAAQSTLGNVIAGFSLLIYRPFKVGDRIQVNAPTGLETGVVETLTLGYTALRTFDNRRIILPNSAAVSQVLANLTSVDARAMTIIPVSLPRDGEIGKVRSILFEVAKELPGVIEVQGCPVTKVRADRLELSLQVWCQDADAANQCKALLLERAAARFLKENMNVALG